MVHYLAKPVRPQSILSLVLAAAVGCEISDEQLPIASPGQPSAAAEQAPLVPVTRPASAAVTTIRKGQLPFVQGFAAGLEQARAENRPMLVFFTAEWCGYCHQLADDAFCNPEVLALAQNFCCVLVDGDAEPATVSRFEVRGFPTIQFLSPSGVPLNRVTGKRPAAEIVQEMQAALHAVARRMEAPAQTLR